MEYKHLIDLATSDENELKVLEKKLADINGRIVSTKERARLLKAEITRLKSAMKADESFFQLPQLHLSDTASGKCAIM